MKIADEPVQMSSELPCCREGQIPGYANPIPQVCHGFNHRCTFTGSAAVQLDSHVVRALQQSLCNVSQPCSRNKQRSTIVSSSVNAHISTVRILISDYAITIKTSLFMVSMYYNLVIQSSSKPFNDA